MAATEMDLSPEKQSALYGKRATYWLAKKHEVDRAISASENPLKTVDEVRTESMSETGLPTPDTIVASRPTQRV